MKIQSKEISSSWLICSVPIQQHCLWVQVRDSPSNSSISLPAPDKTIKCKQIVFYSKHQSPTIHVWIRVPYRKHQSPITHVWIRVLYSKCQSPNSPVWIRTLILYHPCLNLGTIQLTSVLSSLSESGLCYSITHVWIWVLYS